MWYLKPLVPVRLDSSVSHNIGLMQNKRSGTTGFLFIHKGNAFLVSLCFRGNVGLSAVCAYNMSSVHEVFSKGKYMQKATVEQSHTKWVRFNGVPPSPRPGAVSICPKHGFQWYISVHRILKFKGCWERELVM